MSIIVAASIAVGGAMGNLVLGFILGKYHERLGWNDLIRRGILCVLPKK